jgi:hypothetical protein
VLGVVGSDVRGGGQQNCSLRLGRPVRIRKVIQFQSIISRTRRAIAILRGAWGLSRGGRWGGGKRLSRIQRRAAGRGAGGGGVEGIQLLDGFEPGRATCRGGGHR